MFVVHYGVKDESGNELCRFKMVVNEPSAEKSRKAVQTILDAKPGWFKIGTLRDDPTVIFIPWEEAQKTEVFEVHPI